jgi:hypothetical protein
MTKLLNEYEAQIQSLQVSSLRAQFVGGDAEVGKQERYIGVPGYLLVQRPYYLRITLQNPVTKTSLADMVSDESQIKIWIPRLNKFFTGPSNLSKIDYPKANENPLANLRPQHILPALLFSSPFSNTTDHVFIEEETDVAAKYYVVGVAESAGNSELRLRRKIWIERSELQLARERYYAGEGTPIAEIRYSSYQNIDRHFMAARIELQRFIEHYSMVLDFQRIQVNPVLSASAFQLNKIPTAELVMLQEGKP